MPLAFLGKDRLTMNQKELREIRRRIRPEHNSITHLYGCYVNGSGEIISTLNESLGLLTAEEQEKYFALLKKSLSGALGKNLLDIAFATKQVLDSDEHRLLSALRKSEGQDPALLDQFYHTIIGHLDLDGGNYLILLAFDTYDVPHYGKDGSLGDAGEVYRYMLCAVCPVEGGKSELGYTPEDKRFHSAAAGQVVSAPELGFLFPAFDDRAANIYGALMYNRSKKDGYDDFVQAVFRTKPAMAVEVQHESFREVLADALEEECSAAVIKNVHSQLREMVQTHKDARDPEPLRVDCETLSDVLEDSGVTEQKLAAFRVRYEQTFGSDSELPPQNLMGGGKLEYKTPSVSIKLDPDRSDLIELREMGGTEYLVVRADEGVEINGIPVK